MADKKMSVAERSLIWAIVDRAEALYTRLGIDCDRASIAVDVSVCHTHVCPLDLAAMLAGSDGDFAHDIGGLNRHLDWKAAKMNDCFLPRFALLNHEVGA